VLTAELVDEGAAVVLTGISERLSPEGRVALMARLAGFEADQVRRTINEGGIGGSWPAHSELTAPGNLLHKTGALMAGIQMGDVSPEAVEVISKAPTETGVDYPAVQNYGMTIHSKPRDEGGKGFLAWQGGGGEWFVAQQITIPAREFMMFRPEDPETIQTLAAAFLFGEEAAL
jgi:phage gpG-like protein